MMNQLTMHRVHHLGTHNKREGCSVYFTPPATGLYRHLPDSQTLQAHILYYMYFLDSQSKKWRTEAPCIHSNGIQGRSSLHILTPELQIITSLSEEIMHMYSVIKST